MLGRLEGGAIISHELSKYKIGITTLSKVRFQRMVASEKRLASLYTRAASLKMTGEKRA